MVERLRFSKFVHCWEKDDIVAIFHSLTRKVVFADRKLLASVRSFVNYEYEKGGREIVDKSVVRSLKQQGILVSINSRENDEIKKLQERILQHPSIDTLYLILTDGCNFDCTYCFFEGSYGSVGTKHKMMSTGTAITAIRNFSSYFKEACNFPDFNSSTPSIIFYGGEPFLNLSVFYSAVKKVESMKKRTELPAETTMCVNTNGSLITPEIAEFCAAHDIEVDVSLDGWQSVNDRCRIWKKTRKGTFNDVVKGISVLQEKKAKVCISCTISEANSEELPAVAEWFLDELGINRIGFNPLLDSYQYQIQDPDYPNKVARSIIECFKVARKRGIQEDRIMRKVNAFVDGYIYDRDCCGYGKQVVVRPDGGYGVCHAYSGTGEFFTQPGKHFNPYKHPFWQEWSRRSPLNMPQCYDCEALTFCGGGCAHNAYLRKGSIWEIDTSFCIHAKETIQWLVWDLYNQTQQ